MAAHPISWPHRSLSVDDQILVHLLPCFLMASVCVCVSHGEAGGSTLSACEFRPLMVKTFMGTSWTWTLCTGTGEWLRERMKDGVLWENR